MHGEYIALVSLAGSLLATLVISTWRFSSLASKLLTAVQQLEKKDSELEARLKTLDAIPALDLRVGHLERNHSLIPDLQQRVRVLETKAEFSKELRAMRISRPDSED